ncbi:MAG TPA: hypothetical protein VKB93_07130 [Thermoanaerobaculia bacterium]|nr:hypothetical protein [Thermoanaerobaculia bacterium]
MILRFLGALIAAALAVLLIGVIGAAAKLSPSTGGIALLLVTPTVFILAFRALGTKNDHRRQTEKAIEQRKREAIEKELPEKVQTIGDGLAPGGVFDGGVIRVTGGAAPRIDLLVNGQWVTVFAAQYHQSKQGQIVPYAIEKERWVTDWRREKYDPHVVRTKEVGGHAAWWEIQAYIPGEWEESLDSFADAAKSAAVAREQGRFGV